MPRPLSRPLTPVLLSTLALMAVTSCGYPGAEPALYVTEYGLGPDKWATAWLLTQSKRSRGALRVVEDATQERGTPFDVQDAHIRRIRSQAAFEVAQEVLELQDPVIERLGRIIHRIEVDFWSQEISPEADAVEGAYRALQIRHGRDRVSPACYVAFFDRVYHVLEATTRGAPFDTGSLDLACSELLRAAGMRREIIPEIPVADVLTAMAEGRRVIFVDVREADEFAEAHIPGALNIPLRAVGPGLVAQLQGAEYVVSYCVKDFRGFEMAKALATQGVANSVIMRPYGIKGWVALGLPVTGTSAMSESEAHTAIGECLRAPRECARSARS